MRFWREGNENDKNPEKEKKQDTRTQILAGIPNEKLDSSQAKKQNPFKEGLKADVNHDKAKAEVEKNGKRLSTAPYKEERQLEK